MLRKGYVEKQMEAIGQFLGLIVQLIADGQLDKAQAELRTAGKQAVGMDTETLSGLTEDSLTALFWLDGVLDGAKALTAALLLDRQADVYGYQDRRDRAISARRKALMLWLDGMIAYPWIRTPDRLALTERMRSDLEDTPLSLPILTRLFRYDESVGAYSRAEDALWQLKDEGYPDWSTLATEFYTRLLEQPDEALERGNLPREEVEAGLEEVRAPEEEEDQEE